MPAPIALHIDGRNSNGENMLFLFLSTHFQDDENRINIAQFYNLPKFYTLEARSSEEAEFFSKDVNVGLLRPFILKLISVIEDQSKIEKAKHLKESDILEYFTNNYENAEIFAGLMEQHLMMLKNKNSKIIQTWNYYGEFSKLLKKMRKEHNNSDSDDYWRYHLVRKSNNDGFAFIKLNKAQLEKTKGSFTFF